MSKFHKFEVGGHCYELKRELACLKIEAQVLHRRRMFNVVVAHLTSLHRCKSKFQMASTLFIPLDWDWLIIRAKVGTLNGKKDELRQSN